MVLPPQSHGVPDQAGEFLVEDDGHDQDDADKGDVPGRWCAERDQLIAEADHDERPQHCTYERSPSAREEAAPDHRGGDRLEFQELAECHMRLWLVRPRDGARETRPGWRKEESEDFCSG